MRRKSSERSRKLWRSSEKEGRCESHRGGDEVYPTTVRNKQKTGFKLEEENKASEYIQVIII